MTWKRLGSAAALSFGLGLGTAAAWAEETIWRPVTAKVTPGTVAAARVSLGRPVPLAELGRPTVLAETAAASNRSPFDPFVSPASAQRASATIVRAQAAEPAAPPPPPPPPPPGRPGEVFNPGAMSAPPNQTFWDKCKGWFDFSKNEAPCNRATFASEPCFQNLISPVSSPFFFEDPRALTEARVVGLYQRSPGQPVAGRIDSEYFGLQGRLAFTEHWSIVVNKLGLVGLQPDGTIAGNGDQIGFAEVNVGPKWTFLRNDAKQTVAAVGLTFQIPVGSSKVFQDTGDLGLDPYLSIAQSIRLPEGYGAFNLMGTFGYDFAIDSKRTEFTHLSLHLDYNIASANFFYPLIEMNWYHTTKAGSNTSLGFEGGDLVNFGSSTTGGKDLVTLALGARYKFNEHAQLGGVFEFPLTNKKDLTDYRIGLDFIIRY